MAIRSQHVFQDHKWLSLDDDTVGIYNARDCIATARVHRLLREEQERNGQYTHYRNTYWPFVEHVLQLSRQGLLLDKPRLESYAASVYREIKSCEFDIFKATGEELNLNSNRQVANLLFNKLKLRPFKFTDTGNQSVDQEALDRCLRNLRKKDEHARPVLETIFHRSRYSTIAKRYLHMPADPDGRVRPTIKCGKVETLRLAYADPALQQMPKEVRHVFIPKPGHVFVSCDYSQLEARILATLSNDEASLEVFRLGEDVHASNAMDLVSITPVEWEAMAASPREATRNLAKAFLYGISYGGKAETLKARTFCPCPRCAHKVPNLLTLSRADMKAAELRWFSKHPAVQAFRESLEEIARYAGLKKAYTTAFGYKRIFFNPMPDVLTEMYNFPMQANAAGLMNERLAEVQQAKLPLVLQMHDELMLESPIASAKEQGEELQHIMEAPVNQLGGVVFPTDLSFGEDWGSLKAA